MGQLLAFLFKYRAFIVFLFLEVLCIWMIVGNNDYQRTAFINGASGFIGSVNKTSRNIGDYFELSRVNEELATENARLRALLLSQMASEVTLDSTEQVSIVADTTDTVQYVLRQAEIVQNSIRNANNFFMINKGSRDSIKPNMGVMNSFGVVGKIRSVSERYAEGVSVLNTKNPVSVKHVPSGRVGTLQWGGTNPKVSDLFYITPDVTVQEGDTIVTSSYNAIFPKEVMVGTVASVTEDANKTYLQIKVKLSVDYGKLSYVYIIENLHKAEQDSLVETNPIDQQ